jgi:hypothetical protein
MSLNSIKGNRFSLSSNPFRRLEKNGDLQFLYQMDFPLTRIPNMINKRSYLEVNNSIESRIN